MQAFKVVAVVETSEGLSLYLSLFAPTRRIYFVGWWHRDGPFYLCRDYLSAKQFAQSILPRFPHLAIFEAECIPLEPQPRYFPAWFSTAIERLKWRGLVVEDVRAADSFLIQAGIAEPLQVWEILALEFRLLGEPIVEYRREDAECGVGNY